MNLHCWWFGCDPHPLAPPEHATCVRCGEYVAYADMVGDTRHGRLMERLYRLWRFFYPKKCTDCFRRWRRCDETVDHIPF
jgi:hypothetical protein